MRIKSALTSSDIRQYELTIQVQRGLVFSGNYGGKWGGGCAVTMRHLWGIGAYDGQPMMVGVCLYGGQPMVVGVCLWWTAYDGWGVTVWRPQQYIE